MKKFLTAVLIVLGTYEACTAIKDRIASLEPLYDRPYIVVYGTDNSVWTQRILRELNAAGVQFFYGDLDSEATRDELYPRMEQMGMDPEDHTLPVLDVNARLFVRPDLQTILAVYREEAVEEE